MSNQVPIAEGLFTWPADKPALLGSRCNECGIASFPVADSCMACSGQDVSVEQLPGRGTLWTWTVQQFMPKSPYNSNESMETFTPYGVGYLELPGGVLGSCEGAVWYRPLIGASCVLSSASSAS